VKRGEAGVEVGGWWKQKVVAQIMECEGIFVPQLQFCILNRDCLLIERGVILHFFLAHL